MDISTKNQETAEMVCALINSVTEEQMQATGNALEPRGNDEVHAGFCPENLRRLITCLHILEKKAVIKEKGGIGVVTFTNAKDKESYWYVVLVAKNTICALLGEDALFRKDWEVAYPQSRTLN